MVGGRFRRDKCGPGRLSLIAGSWIVLLILASSSGLFDRAAVKGNSA